MGTGICHFQIKYIIISRMCADVMYVCAHGMLRLHLPFIYD